MPTKRLIIHLPLILATLAWTAVAHADEAGELASRAGITQELAAHDLATQRSRPFIVEDLKQTLGSAYGGVWFNNKTGYFMVDRPPGVTTTQAQAAVGSAPAKYPLVAHTWGELEQSQVSLDSALSGYEMKQQAGTYPDAQTNRVKVLYASNLTLAQKEEIKATAASAGATTTSTQAALLAPAATAEAECRKPFCMVGGESGYGIVLGGVSIRFGENASCTAGFVLWNGGNPLMLGAGHCDKYLAEWEALRGPPYNYYRPQYAAQSPCQMHDSAWYFDSEHGDEGLATLAGCEYQQSVVNWKQEIGVSETLTVAPKANTLSCIGGKPCSNAKPAWTRSYKGLWSCHSGGKTGTHCGEVTANNLNVTVEVEGQRIQDKHMESICTEVAGGDSGGPMWTRSSEAGRAYGTGLVTAGAYNSNCATYGTELWWALSELGVSF